MSSTEKTSVAPSPAPFSPAAAAPCPEDSIKPVLRNIAAPLIIIRRIKGCRKNFVVVDYVRLHGTDPVSGDPFIINRSIERDTFGINSETRIRIRDSRSGKLIPLPLDDFMERHNERGSRKVWQADIRNGIVREMEEFYFFDSGKEAE